ncbi:MAG: hypothetical protein V4507_09355, partial [Verrucomicrobiota bacterium]
MIFFLVFSLQRSEAQTWQAGTSDWNTVGNWTTANVPDTNTETAAFSTTGSTTIDLSANTIVKGLSFGVNSQAYTIQSSSGKTLTIDINAGADANAFALTASSGAVTVNTNLIFTDSNAGINEPIFSLAAGSSLTINGNITTASGTYTVGAGGTLSINGSINLNGGQFENTSSVTTYFNPTSVTNVGSVRGETNNGKVFLMRDFSTGTISVGLNGPANSTGKMYLGTDGMSMSRNFTFFSGSGAGIGNMTFGADMSSGGTATQAGTVTISTGAAGSTNTDNFDATDSNDILNITSVISGTVTAGSTILKKTGNGTVIFGGTAANTFASGAGTASVDVAAGTLELNKTAGVNAIGNVAITVDSGATLKWD